MADKLTDDELATLTDAEREAMDDPPAGPPAATDPPEAGATGDPPADPPATAAKTDEQQDVAAGPAIPDWSAPENGAERLKAIPDERKALAQKFDDGDITGVEFAEQLARLNSEETDIKIASSRATMGEDMRVRHWVDVSVAEFLEEHPEYRDNATLNMQLDRLVREAQVKAGENGADPFDPKILDDAHTAIVEASNAVLAASKKDPPPAAEKRPAAPPPPTDRRPETPPTLAKVPAADMTIEGDASGFEALDRLAASDPIAYEDAFAKLPAHQREAYLRQQ